MMDAYGLWNLIEENKYRTTRLSNTDIIGGYIQLLSEEEINNISTIADSAIIIDCVSNMRNADILDIQLLYQINSFLNVIYERDEDSEMQIN